MIIIIIIIIISIIISTVVVIVKPCIFKLANKHNSNHTRNSITKVTAVVMMAVVPLDIQSYMKSYSVVIQLNQYFALHLLTCYFYLIPVKRNHIF